eukprot:m.217360 g.217360  ORF g.217360 m.217360 type:complete len:297 (-) comp19123_c0_seq2:746-1636(-)
MPTPGMNGRIDSVAGSQGSFQADMGYGDDTSDTVSSPSAVKPRILLMGLRRSGKSSIQKVVFHKMSPNETLFLESTSKIVKDDIANTSFVQFEIWDFPGQIDYFDPAFDSEIIFGGCGALVFVIDAQDEYMESLAKLHETVTKAYKVNPHIRFEVFIHKVDGLSEDHKLETTRDIQQRVSDELEHAGLPEILLSFHLTSIYDHSIFVRMVHCGWRVFQSLVDCLCSVIESLCVWNNNSPQTLVPWLALGDYVNADFTGGGIHRWSVLLESHLASCQDAWLLCQHCVGCMSFTADTR